MKQNNGIATVLMIGIAGVLFAASLYLFNANTLKEGVEPVVDKNVEKSETVSAPAPSPFEFEELTIPYLRNRVYKSTLADFREYSNNSDYINYLTSYDSDGLKINGLLAIPKGDVPEGGWPAVVFVHGYIPPESYNTTSNYASFVDYLARNGFVVFKIDLRGHDDSEGIASGGYYSGGYVIDTLNAAAALSETDFINKDRIGTWGHSMAGNVTFRALVASDKINTAVIWAGAVYTYEDMQEFGIDDNSYRPPAEDSPRRRERERLRELHGDFDPGSTFWQMVVPTNYLDGVEDNLQINHAVDDSVVSIDYSRNLQSVLYGTGFNFELNELPTGGHNITGSSFNEAMQNTVEFYRDNL